MNERLRQMSREKKFPAMDNLIKTMEAKHGVKPDSESYNVVLQGINVHR